jgi:sugar O-acyltransferase (sialic acid O-acetyltransferase NeuD family)
VKYTENLHEELLIYGCGGHSKAVTELASLLGIVNIKYIEDIFTVPRREFLGNPVLHAMPSGYKGNFFVAVGDNSAREKIYCKFKLNNPDANPISLIHPMSYVASTAQIEEGVVVLALGYVGSECRVGKGAFVSPSVISHESVLGEFCSIAPGVVIAGGVSVGKRSAILVGANIKNKVSIGDDCVVGGASFVRTNVADNSVVYGVPARFIRTRKPEESYLD